MPNKLSQFWQELKRRRVIHVITVYASASYVIIELASNLTEPLNLPPSLSTIVIIGLAVGFLPAIILSWIYDLSSGTLKRTEPVEELQDEKKAQVPNAWKIATFISFAVIVALLILNIIPRVEEKQTLEKSIVVLPFINESADQENAQFLNTMMGSIHDNLCRIKDLRVVSRISAEQYRNNAKPSPIVAKEMDVSYILAGYGQKIGDRLILTVQLIIGSKDRAIWSKPYDREIQSMDDLYDIQSEIAESVADQINAVITPEVKTIIETPPTTSLTAYDYYSQGISELGSEPQDHKRAMELFNRSLELDPDFSLGYLGLSIVHSNLSGKEDFLNEDYLDSALYYVNKAIHFDKQSFSAFAGRGLLHWERGDMKLARNDLNKAIELNPNYGEAYYIRGLTNKNEDYVKVLDGLHKAASMQKGLILSERLENLAGEFLDTGFKDKAIHYFTEALKLDGDSASYYGNLGLLEYYQQNYRSAIKHFQKANVFGYSYWDIKSAIGYSYLGISLYREGMNKEALENFEKYIERLDEWIHIGYTNLNRVAYSYLINGNDEMADFYFDMQKDYLQKLIESGRVDISNPLPYYDLAAIYAFRGDSAKAYENLWKLCETTELPVWVSSELGHDELFSSISDSPEFLDIVHRINANSEAMHNRVRQWLEDNNML